ncbi:hypothetical protein EC2864350_5093 [Escherichia coli 2864350]|nr:hypothetical protein EC2864350_5093 [Escherichia coli 2864350]
MFPEQQGFRASPVVVFYTVNDRFLYSTGLQAHLACITQGYTSAD